MVSNIVQAIQHVKMANEFMQDFIRSTPNTRGAYIFKDYSRRLNWIITDILTYPHFQDDVRKGISTEIKSDPFATPAIVDRVSLLNSEQREMIEDLIEDILKGKTIHVDVKQ